MATNDLVLTILNNTSTSNTWTGIQTFANGTLVLAGSTSGGTTLSAQAVASGNITFPALTDTAVTITSSQTLTNKTLTSPIMTTPTLGVATATSLNGMTISSTTGTLSLANGKTVNLNASLTLAGSDGTTMTFPSSSDTVVTLGATQTLTNKTLTSPTMTTPTLGAATVTTINGLTVTASTGTITIANGKTLTANNSLTLAGTDSTTMTFPGSSDTVVTLGATQTLTNKTLTSPTMTTPTLGTVGSGTWQGTVVGITYGGTGSNLSGTGGSNQVLQQASSGAAVTVGQLATTALSDISSFSLNTSGTIKTSNSTASTTTATGALISGGGLGVAGAIFTGGIINFASGLVGTVRVVTASGAITAATTDYVIVVNKNTPAATTVNLMSSPTTGTMLRIKDGAGNASEYPITVTPNSGNIDGAASFIIQTPYGELDIVYNATQWNII